MRTYRLARCIKEQNKLRLMMTLHQCHCYLRRRMSKMKQRFKIMADSKSSNGQRSLIQLLKLLLCFNNKRIVSSYNQVELQEKLCKPFLCPTTTNKNGGISPYKYKSHSKSFSQTSRSCLHRLYLSCQNWAWKIGLIFKTANPQSRACWFSQGHQTSD